MGGGTPHTHFGPLPEADLGPMISPTKMPIIAYFSQTLL